MPSIRLDDRNPRYLVFRGRPVVLVGSGEHYGAVLNADFDYVRYLDAVAEAELNLTRIFSGTYREIPGSFGIVGNTLAPRPEAFNCPWPRSRESGATDGGTLFDLSRWNDAYFDRLRDFLAEAGRRGIVVEYVFFCFWYDDDLWRASPIHAGNAVNAPAAPPADRHAVYDPDGPLWALQEALVQKVAAELNEFDNLYYEPINEPYSLHDGSAFLPWQNRLAETLAEAERGRPNRHLIARNVQNLSMRVDDLHPVFSIVNFHYAQRAAADMNYHLRLPLADDETGFRGQCAEPYRKEAWQFLLAGGSIVSHLDYSFTVACPDGSALIEGRTPGYGGPDMRRSLRALREFLQGFDLPAMTPHTEVAGTYVTAHPEGVQVSVLADPGRAYAIYVHGGGPITTVWLGMPAGQYRARWVCPADGAAVREELWDHRGGPLELKTPPYQTDLALAVKRTA